MNAATGDEPSRNRGWWLTVGFGIGAFVLALVAWRLADDTLPSAPQDLGGYFLPAMVFLRQSLLEGELPLWNPFQFAGEPFIACHAPGALYPLLIILTPFPPHLALALHGVLHLVLAGIFAALFGGSIGLGPSASLAIGLGYVASRPVTGAIYNTAYLSAFVWLPAILLAIEGLLRRPGWRSALLLAGALALSFLSGHAQAFLYSMEAGVLYGAARLLMSSPRPHWLKTLGWACVAGALAVGLIAIQLLPAAFHAVDASRNLDGMKMGLAYWSPRKWSHLPTILLGQGHEGDGVPFLFVPLVIAALASRRRGLAVLFLGLYLLFFDFITGSNGYGFRLHFALPGGNLFRLPMRMAFVYQLVVAVLMGLGTQAMIRGAGRWRSGAAVLVAVAIPLALGIDLYWRNPLTYRYDIWNNLTPLYGSDAVAEFMHEAGPDRMFVQNGFAIGVPRNFGMLHGVNVMSGYNPILPGIYRRFFRMDHGLWHGKLDVVGPFFGRARSAQAPELLDLLSVRFYVDDRGNERLPSKVGPAVDGRLVQRGLPAVFERASALPRVYIVKDVVGVQSDEDALRRVHSLDFDPSRTAVVVGLATLSNGSVDADEFAEIESLRRNAVAVNASCNSDCLLVLTDLYDPEWSVDVDGDRRELLQTNYAVRGVRLGAGTHRVVFRYRARQFWAGATITAATLAVIAIISWRRRRGHRG